MLGIDIGTYSIKAAVAKKSGRNVTIEQVACEVLPFEARGGAVTQKILQNAVDKLIKKIGKGQTTVALSAPTSSAILKTLQLDSSLSDDALESEVQLEMMNFVPFPLDQIYIDYINLGPSENAEGNNEILVAASRKDVVDKIAESVNAKAIKSKEIEVEAFAISQLLEVIKGKGYRDAHAVVDIGFKTSTICVFQSDDMLFSREQQIGGNHLTEAIAEANGIEMEEAESIKHNSIHSIPSVVLENYIESVIEQVALAFEFYSSSSQESLGGVYVTGGGSLVPGLVEQLNENISMFHFETLPIGNEIKLGKKIHGITRDEACSSTAVVCGLAMRK